MLEAYGSIAKIRPMVLLVYMPIYGTVIEKYSNTVTIISYLAKFTLFVNSRTNLPVQLMEFTGYKFEAESGLCYPYHNDVLKYINDFVDHYELRKWIKVSKPFRTDVTIEKRINMLSKFSSFNLAFSK